MTKAEIEARIIKLGKSIDELIADLVRDGHQPQEAHVLASNAFVYVFGRCQGRLITPRVRLEDALDLFSFLAGKL